LELIQSARDAALTEYVSPLAVRVASGTVLASDGIRDEDAQSTISTTHSGQGIREAASGSIAGGVPGAIPLPQCAALAMAPAAVRGRWLQLFRDSYAFAYAFNQDVDRRTAIFRRGFVPQLPNLSKQEVVSCTSLVRTMFALYMRNGDEEFVEMAAEPAWLAEARASEIPIEYLPSGDGAFLGGLTGDGAVVRVELAVCLISLVNSVLSRFVEQGKDQRRHAKELGQWAPLVAAIYRDLSVFVETHHRRGEGEEDRFGGFRRSVAGFFKLGIQLIHVDKAEVRWALERFMESISGLISLA
jgi:brefeldin A-inhibited guanine nucleotide-exchange protein